MRLLQRATGGRKAFGDGWVEPPFWSLDALRLPFLAATSSTGDEQLATDFEGYVATCLRDSGVVFACAAARMRLFSEARFAWRRVREGRPAGLFATPELGLLERPYPNGTTGELLARMELDVSMAGNAYLTTADDKGRFGSASKGGPGRRIVRMRPDWVTILAGSRREQAGPNALDARVIGYLYAPLGATDAERVTLLPDEVVHWSPIPDPLTRWRGMSWVTPILREIEADRGATAHKGRFFRNGARHSYVMTLDKSVSPANLKAFRDIYNSEHQGPENAYKTLFLGGGADIKPLSVDLKQLDFKAVQGAGETRIAAAAGVPPIVVGLSEGLESATYSNYGQARRSFADGTMRPLWRSASAALATLLDVPADAHLWFDDRDISFLQEDRRDAAEIQGREAETIARLTDAGFIPKSVVAAVAAEDFSLLQHSGMYSVQLQTPGASESGTTTEEQ